jgi:hypothetical protein
MSSTGGFNRKFNQSSNFVSSVPSDFFRKGDSLNRQTTEDFVKTDYSKFDSTPNLNQFTATPSSGSTGFTRQITHKVSNNYTQPQKTVSSTNTRSNKDCDLGERIVFYNSKKI